MLERQGYRVAFLELGLQREGLTIIGVLPSHETVELGAQAADVLSQAIDTPRASRRVAFLLDDLTLPLSLKALDRQRARLAAEVAAPGRRDSARCEQSELEPQNEPPRAPTSERVLDQRRRMSDPVTVPFAEPALQRHRRFQTACAPLAVVATEAHAVRVGDAEMIGAQRSCDRARRQHLEAVPTMLVRAEVLPDEHHRALL